MRLRGLKTIFLGVLITAQISSNPPEVKDSELGDIYGGYLRTDIQIPLKSIPEKIILWDEKRAIQKKHFKNY